MAPTPPAYGGVLRTIYIVDGLEHHYDLYCNIQSEAGNLSTIVNMQPLGATIGIDDAGDSVWNLVRPSFQNTVVAPNYVLYKRDINILIPIGSLPGTLGGSSAVVYTKASQQTFTWRTTNQTLMKLILLEGIHPPPNRILPGGNAYTDSVFDGFTDATAGLDPHDWIVGKDNQPVSRAIAWTTSENDKVRRARGLL